MAVEPVVFRNNMAVAGWIFMVIWLGFLCLFTWLFVRDGGFHQFHPLVERAIMAIFWLFGLGGAGEMFALPRVRLSIAGGEATLRESRLLVRREERMAAASVAVPPLLRERDSDGELNFICVVVTPAGRRVTIRESPDEAATDAFRARLAAALAA